MSGRFEPGPARAATPGRWLERDAKRRLSRVLAAVVRPRPVSSAAARALPVRRLLVLRPHNQLGDMVCALPALHALRRAWPQAHLVFVASPLAEPLLAGHADIDELVVLRKAELWRPWGAARLLRRLRSPRADLAVVMTTVSFSTTSALLALASGARVRAGSSSLPFGSHLSRAVYHIELPAAPEGLHEAEHGLLPLAALGIEPVASRPRLTPSNSALRHADTMLATLAPGRGPVVVAHVGAGKLPNIWPADRFAAVLAALQREHAAQIVLLEGPNDADAVAGVAARLDSAPRWRAPLQETMGLLARARLVVANDTGMAHVAAAVGAPTVVIFGPTDARRWRPPGDHVHVVRSPTGSIADVAAEAVLAPARAMLERARERPHVQAARDGRRD